MRNPLVTVRADFRGATEALRLRAWAFQRLARRGGALSPPAVPARAWELFLRSEACALPLRSTTVAGADAGWLASPGGRLLALRATVELQRVMSGRAQLRSIGSVAAGGGWRVAVLKGGAAVGAGTDLDLGDLDLLATRDTAEALARTLDAGGYRPQGGAGSHRLPVRVAENFLPLEIHFALPGAVPGTDLLGRARPCEGMPGVLRLAPVDQLWHLLLHVVVQHHERRARIRDLLLVSHALGECSAEERREVEGRAAGHPFRTAMGRVVQLAGALRGEVEIEDHFRGLAAGSYLMRGWVQPLPLPDLLSNRLRASVFWRLGADGGGERPWVDPGFGLAMPSGFRALSWLHARAPGADRALRRFLRTAPTWALAPVAALIARAARRAARESTEKEP